MTDAKFKAMVQWFKRWLRREGMAGFDMTAQTHAWRAFKAGVRYGRTHSR